VNPIDPRARRTRDRLRAAVRELAADHDPAAISMGAIARHADVNRATVYAHHSDVDSLVADALDDTIAHVARAAALCPLDAPRDRPPAPLVELFTRVGADAVLVARVLGPHGSPRAAAELRERTAAALAERFDAGARPAGTAGVDPEVHAAYLAGALTGVLAHWTAGGPAVPAEDAALAFWRLLRAGPGD
jgi:AcrR family transcriptional regulator